MLLGGAAVVLVLAVWSLFVGVADVTPAALLDADRRADALDLIGVSRVPRTVALVLAGAGLAVSGLIMQLLTRNPFVEPSTTGTMEFAGLGLLGVAIGWPDAPVAARMAIAAACALAGTAVFLRLVRSVTIRDVLVVPLIGLVLSGIVGAVATFVAYRYDLLQSLGAWMTGDFSATIQGRYELLWIAGALTVVSVVVADRFTVAGLGEDVATNLGLDYRRTMAIGMSIVAVVTATVVVTVGMLGFIGLVVPNLVVLAMGGNARSSVPWVALGGAGLVLLCDLLARSLVAPHELPIGTILGVVGAGAFLAMLVKGVRGVR
ncbi:iron chelate uptake ABC transporter family permease subunit [Arsenicicoccus sp. MKL-02]|uniref:Iron chelate uptake ABC transporter family permease subunit n=1 Tax=Arsenicicoccus cauae TaxID=2663847 RepID=A0A6I3IXL7_9MICO|nr:iron chelate uptake ABC transporter family permease subunit [Arsenicicoccus cauae]